MRALEQVMSTVGAPLSLTEFRDLDGHAVAVCRWRHSNGRFEVRSSDALRVGMNLGGAFKGRHVGAGQIIDITGTSGAIGMFAPGASCETTGEGTIDIVEIYIEARGLDYPAREWPEFPPLDCADGTVRAAVVATFAAARARDGLRLRSAATMLRRLACQFYRSQAQREDRPHKGGLRPIICRRVEHLIKTWLDAPQGCALSVGELSAEAGLSVNHFIRAFRQATGTTPHQHLIARRQQRALALLGDPGRSIADVADSLGFSSPAHFVASFRQKLWVTPGAYRDAVLGTGNPSGILRSRRTSR